MHKAYFSIIPANVRYDAGIPANAKLLYGEITALCNQEGYCWASNDYFAKQYGVHKKTISDWISRLQKGGYIWSKLVYREGSKEVKERRIYITPPSNHGEGGSQITDTPPSNHGEGRSQITDTPLHQITEDNSTSFNNTFNNTTNTTTSTFQTDKKIVYQYYEKVIGSISSIISQTLEPYIKELGSEIVNYGVDLCSLNNKRSCNYLEGILKNYVNAKVKSLSDVKKLEEEYERKKNNKSYQGNRQNSNPNSFVNFPQRDDWDFDKLERLEREYQEKKLNESDKEGLPY